MITLENIIGTYTPIISETGQIGVDYGYISRAVVLVLCLWITGLCVVNFFKSFR